MFAVWSFYVLTFVGVIKLRKTQPNLHRPYKVPLYPIIPITAILGGIIRCIKSIIICRYDKHINIFRWSCNNFNWASHLQSSSKTSC